jgi:hypothetical protein
MVADRSALGPDPAVKLTKDGKEHKEAKSIRHYSYIFCDPTPKHEKAERTPTKEGD